MGFQVPAELFREIHFRGMGQELTQGMGLAGEITRSPGLDRILMAMSGAERGILMQSTWRWGSFR